MLVGQFADLGSAAVSRWTRARSCNWVRRKLSDETWSATRGLPANGFPLGPVSSLIQMPLFCIISVAFVWWMLALRKPDAPDEVDAGLPRNSNQIWRAHLETVASDAPRSMWYANRTTPPPVRKISVRHGSVSS
jgi:hypothetical protein